MTTDDDAVCADADFHVSPGGDDANSGTERAPFRTLARARDAVREKIAQRLTRDVTVLLRGGVYELDEPVVFGPEDSGTDEHSITYAAYPGESPIISGGRRIAGWRRESGGLRTAHVPGLEGAPRSLFVDDARAPRARTPNRDDAHPYWTLERAELSEDLSTFALDLPRGLARAWRDIENVEVVVLGAWEVTRKRLAAADEAAGRVILAPPHVEGHSAIRPAANMACYFENAVEMLDRPGEWHLDRGAAVLRYRPRAEEDASQVRAVAPALSRLLTLAGARERPVRNLHFTGLRFAHARWAPPGHGYNGIQACFHFPPEPAGGASDDALENLRIDSAVEWEYAERCSLIECEIAHTEGTGLSLRRGCCDNLIQRNRIFDAGANGLMVGENLCHLYHADREPPAADVPRRNVIRDNRVEDCGVEYHGAVGIWVAFTDGTVVAHNLVHDLPYTGISVGFIWNDTPTVCRGNVVEYNHIHDVMKLLADGGGIYTLGLQPGTVLRGNLIHDVHRHESTCAKSPNNGIFFDEGSTGYLVEDNVIYNTPEGAVRFNQTTEDAHTWRNNSFDVAPDAPGFPSQRAAQAGPGRAANGR
ncbi:MAG: right-handed parallel beta-helix repeat-containing protein [Armatimonadota bacterium]|nr:MAG: right-handed parallel beta-helix repeat-containing protein [Armatimonadota bacterium]